MTKPTYKMTNAELERIADDEDHPDQAEAYDELCFRTDRFSSLPSDTPCLQDTMPTEFFTESAH